MLKVRWRKGEQREIDVPAEASDAVCQSADTVSPGMKERTPRYAPILAMPKARMPEKAPAREAEP